MLLICLSSLALKIYSKSKLTPSQEGEYDEDIPHGTPLTNVEQDHGQDDIINKGPTTRARIHRLQHEVNLLLNV